MDLTRRALLAKGRYLAALPLVGPLAARIATSPAAPALQASEVDLAPITSSGPLPDDLVTGYEMGYKAATQGDVLMAGGLHPELAAYLDRIRQVLTNGYFVKWDGSEIEEVAAGRLPIAVDRVLVDDPANMAVTIDREYWRWRPSLQEAQTAAFDMAAFAAKARDALGRGVPVPAR